MQKLRYIGVGGRLLSCMQDFLLGRTMQAAVKHTLSSAKEVRSGVPQGSILGPVLLLIYINHVAVHLKSQYKIFADDLKIYMCIIKSELDTIKFQADLDLLHTTALSWDLSMNLKKCAIMRFQRRSHTPHSPTYYLNGEELPWPHSHTDLGATVHNTLKFHEHARVAARKAGGVAHNFAKSVQCAENLTS